MTFGFQTTQNDTLPIAAALATSPRPRMVDQNPAHRLGADGEEMGATLPIHSALVDETHERFMDQRRRLKRMIFPLGSQVLCCEIAEFVINEWQEIPGQTPHRIVPHLFEQLRDLVRFVVHHPVVIQIIVRRSSLQVS